MTDTADDIVTTAAKAAYLSDHLNGGWDDENAAVQAEYLRTAAAVIEAVKPQIRSDALLEAADSHPACKDAKYGCTCHHIDPDELRALAQPEGP